MASSYLDSVLGLKSQQSITGATPASSSQIEKSASSDIATRYEGAKASSDKKATSSFEMPEQAASPPSDTTSTASQISTDTGKQNRDLLASKLGSMPSDGRQTAEEIKAGGSLAAIAVTGGSNPLAWAGAVYNLFDMSGVWKGGSGGNIPKEKDIKILNDSLQLSNIITDPNYYNDPQNKVIRDGEALPRSEAIQYLYQDVFNTGSGGLGQDASQQSQFDSKKIQSMLGSLGVGYDDLKKAVGYDVPDFVNTNMTYTDWAEAQNEKAWDEATKRTGLTRDQIGYTGQRDAVILKDWNFWGGTPKDPNAVSTMTPQDYQQALNSYQQNQGS